METVLAKIVEDKKKWVAKKKADFPLEAFIEHVVASDRDFYHALSKTTTQFILECKKASPSKGLIREDFNLNEIAQAYRPYAAAISVLTDEKYFQGHFDFIQAVRDQVECPVLCKDFMVDPYQVYLARYHHADANLLMLSVLTDEAYRELAQLAHELKLGVLTEVSNQEELERAIALDAKVIGINNRNLRDLSIDLARTQALSPQIPDDRIVISESGIYTHDQVRLLAKNADGFLIGSSLMSEANIPQAVRRVVFGDNKVCGLTSVEDAQAVANVGANYGGLIFVSASPRCVDLPLAKDICEKVPLAFVGVFQNHELDEILKICHQLPFAAIQLHGDEDQAYVDALRQQLPKGVEIWKAVNVTDAVPSLDLTVDRFVLDARKGEQRGGTGRTFDWNLIPQAQRSKIMLAGGLSEENVLAAAELGCLGLDFNSGVESAPGEKDPQKLAAVFAALRDY